jgi:spore maturation protein CgeB
MKIMFIDTYYEDFLEILPNLYPKIDVCTYSEALELTIGHGFGTGAALSTAFNRLGHKTTVVIPNSHLLQSKWCKENLSKQPNSRLQKWSPILNRVSAFELFLSTIGPGSLLEKQVKDFLPDVVYIQDINYVLPENVLRLRQLGFTVVGEIASPLPPDRFLKSYDAIVSALPTIVSYCENLGVKAFNLPLAFDDANVSAHKRVDRDIDTIFIGSVGKAWQTLELLTEVAKEVSNLRIYGPISDRSIAKAGLQEFYFGEAWGAEMFALLNRSKISLNRHGKMAGNYSVNMRMFEATGMGCLLLTDYKSQTKHIFEPDIDLVMYNDLKDAGRLAKKYLDDSQSLESIASSGQRRTLNNHTYFHRATELIEFLETL